MLFPLVEMANKTSPGLPIASNCLLKISSKFISFPILVKVDVFVVKDMVGIAFLFLRYFPTNSAVKC